MILSITIGIAMLGLFISLGIYIKETDNESKQETIYQELEDLSKRHEKLRDLLTLNVSKIEDWSNHVTKHNSHYKDSINLIGDWSTKIVSRIDSIDDSIESLESDIYNNKIILSPKKRRPINVRKYKSRRFIISGRH